MRISEEIHASCRPRLNWNGIPWNTVEKKVKELQMRIAQGHSRTEWPGLFKPEEACKVLEPCAGKLARTVLRGRSGSNATLLADVKQKAGLLLTMPYRD